MRVWSPKHPNKKKFGNADRSVVREYYLNPKKKWSFMSYSKNQLGITQRLKRDTSGIEY